MTIGGIGTIGAVGLIGGLLLSGTALSTPWAFPQFGQSDPSTLAGPLGNEPSFTTPEGYELMPSGTGVVRFVNPGVVSSGDGSTLEQAFKTAAEANAVKAAGDLILLEPGYDYPELLHLEPFGDNRATAQNPICWAKRGAGPAPRITATDLFTGWSVCPDTATAFGNPDFANLWYLEMTPAASVPLDHAMLKEAQQTASMNMIAGGMNTTLDMRLPEHISLWFDASAQGSVLSGMTKSAQTGVITIQHPYFEAANFPQGSLDGCQIWINAVNNTAEHFTITSHNAATGEIVFNNDSGNAWTTNQLAFRNVPSKISAPGQWAAREIGGGVWRILYWPHDVANINTDIRISMRNFAMDLDSASNYRFFGIEFGGAGGTKPIDGRNATAVYSRQQNIVLNPVRSNVVFEQCNFNSNMFAGINLIRMDGVRVLNCTSDINLMGSGGFFDRCTNSVVRGNRFSNSGSTAISVDIVSGVIVAHNDIDGVLSVHGNGLSAYLVSEDLVVHGNLFRTRFAIQVTFQDSGRLYYTCNLLMLDPDVASRGLEDNSDFPAGYERSGGGQYSAVLTNFPDVPDIVMMANACVPWPGAPISASTQAAKWGTTTRARHSFTLNVMFGDVVFSDGVDNDPSGPYTVTVVDQSGNTLVGTAGASNPMLGSDGNVRYDNPSDVWIDPDNGDYRPIVGGPLDQSGGDKRSLLPLTEPWFIALGGPAIIAQDFARQAINWQFAPKGPIAGPNSGSIAVATDITPSASSVNEGVPNGTVVADLSANGTPPHVFSKVSGSAALNVVGGQIVTAGTITYPATLSITVRADNTAIGGGTFDKQIDITVNEVAITEPRTILAANEIDDLFDGRTGAATTGSALDSWTDPVGGQVLTLDSLKPTYVGGAYLQFLDGVRDGLRSFPAFNLSGYGLTDLWARARLDAPHNFILVTGGNSAGPYVVIGENGSAGAPMSIAGTVYIDGSPRGTRQAVYDAMVDGQWHTIEVRGIVPNTLTDFHLLGHSSTYKPSMSIAQVLIITNALAGDANQKRADLKTFFDSLSYT